MTANGGRRVIGWLLAGALLALALGASAEEGYVTSTMVPAGWQLGETRQFGPDNLFEQIDGAAPGYTRYSFKTLTVQPVERVDDPQAEILVEVFEFGSHLDAFGIYSNERTPGLKYVGLGAQGYYSPNGCCFYRGPYYVKLESARDDQPTRAALELLAGRLARSLRGETRPPRLLSALPQDGLIPGSERYEGSDLLAHDFLGAGFTADYNLGGDKPAKLFFAIRPDSRAARDAYYRLLGFLRKRGEVGETLRLASGSGRMASQPFYGPTLVCRSGAVVCGVLAVPGQEAGTPLLEALVANLDEMALVTGEPCLPGPRCCR